MSLPRYPAYKDSGVEWLGQVPERWTITKLKHAAAFASGGTPSKAVPEYWDGSVPWASSKDLKFATIANTADHITERAVADGAQLISPGDLMVVVRGMILAHTFPVTKALVPMAINQDLKAIRPHPGWHPDYFAGLLRAASTETFRRLDEAGHGTKALRMETWLGMEVPRPPLPEQVAIASFVEHETAKIDALVAEQQRLIVLLTEKRQAVISHAVTKGLNPDAPMKDSGVEWLGQIPEHWEVRRLKRISPRLAGRLIVQPHQYFVDDGVPIVFGNNIGRGHLDLTDVKFISHEADAEFVACRVRAGDLLTVRVGDPGATAVVPPELDGCHFASAMLIRQAETFDSRWLCHVMNADVVGAQVAAVNYGAAQEQFNIGDAADFALPFPPILEQRTLVAELDRAVSAFDGLISESRRAISLLDERRTALISAAVTGHIDVRSAAERSAA